MGLHQLSRLGLVLLGLLYFPCSASAQGMAAGAGASLICPSSLPISQTASTKVLVGTVGQVQYICGIVLANSGTAQSVNVIRGTGVLCATAVVGILGGTTAATGINLAINANFVAVASGPWFKVPTANQDLCVLQSGSNQLSGVITYRSAPP